MDQPEHAPPAQRAGAATDGSHGGVDAASVEHAARQEGLATAHAEERNRLLRALPAEEHARLLPQLTPVRLHLKDALIEADTPIRDV
jgi:hypothetical protein